MKKECCVCDGENTEKERKGGWKEKNIEREKKKQREEERVSERELLCENLSLYSLPVFVCERDCESESETVKCVCECE